MTQTSTQTLPPRHHEVDLTKAVAIFTRTGELKMFKKNVTLSLDNGGLVTVYGVGTLVTAEGYKMQAAAAGLQTMMANTVIVDGVEQKNPTVTRDPSSHRPLVVTCRAFTLGYTSLGIPIVTDRTVCFDLVACRAHDLLKKCRSDPEAFRLHDIDTRPTKGWTRYPVNDVEAVHVQRSSPEGLAFSTNQASIARKAVERAQTYAARNSIKAHPSILVHKVEGSATVVPILCWRPVTGEAMQWDLSHFTANLKHIEALVSGEGDSREDIQVDKAPIEMVHDDEEAMASVDDLDESDGLPPQDPEPDPSCSRSAMARIRAELKAMAREGSKGKDLVKVISTVTESDPRTIILDQDLDQLTDQQAIQVHKALA